MKAVMGTREFHMRFSGFLALSAPYAARVVYFHSHGSSRYSSRFVGAAATMNYCTDKQGSGQTGSRGGEGQSFAYAYCHGFLSGPSSVKGMTLQRSMLEVGVDLALLNLNGPDNDPGGITCSGALEAVRQFHLDKKTSLGDPGLKLRLTGSSLGGYIVARYAELYPDEVDRIFMLCPSFCLGARAPSLLSGVEMIEWERTGARVFPLSTGGEASVRWAFIEEAKVQPDYPQYECPAMILHGVNDEIVPSVSSKFLMEESSKSAKHTSVIFVDDDHALTQPSTMTLTSTALLEFFELGGEGERASPDRERAEEREGSQKNVEVESKFLADDIDKVKEVVLASGGQLVGEHVFWDAYWDSPDCGLTAKDWWLRNRAGRWELKVPAAEGGGGIFTAYKEITHASEIVGELKAAGLLGSREDKASANGVEKMLLKLIEAAGFTMFASFRTNRTKYRLDGHTVDIDRASFGYQVVEVETMSTKGSAEIASAGDGIAKLAGSLGILKEPHPKHPVKGKLMEYIIANCPKQLEVLKR